MNKSSNLVEHNNMDMNHDMMKMYFHTDLIDRVLFYQWKPTTAAGINFFFFYNYFITGELFVSVLLNPIVVYLDMSFTST